MAERPGRRARVLAGAPSETRDWWRDGWRAVRAGVFGATTGVGLACGSGSAGSAGSAHATSAQGARALALDPGTYLVRSRQYRGDTLVLTPRATGEPVLDARATRGRPPDDGPAGESRFYASTNKYLGRVSRSTAGGDVEFSLLCRCSAGRDAFNQPVYVDSVWNGSYAVRRLGGGLVELRPVYGATAVDTLELRP